MLPPPALLLVEIVAQRRPRFSLFLTVEIQPISSTLAKILLWLFVIDLGIAFGAGLYEHRIVLSHWISKARDAYHSPYSPSEI
jgi:hypothetical protein